MDMISLFEKHVVGAGDFVGDSKPVTQHYEYRNIVRAAARLHEEMK